MSILEDASSPAVVRTAGAAGTTAAFNPPANSLLVVIACGDWDQPGGVTFAVTDNKGGTGWSRLVRSNANCGVDVWVKYLTTAQTGMTVTVTPTNAWASTNTCLYTTKVLTGASATQTGATAASQTFNNANDTLSITPTTIGSRIYGGLASGQTSVNPTANANTAIIDFTNGGTGAFTNFTMKAAADTSSLSAIALGQTTNTSQNDIALVEILPDAGSGTTDKSATETSSGTDAVSLLSRSTTVTETSSASDVVLSMAVSLTASDLAGASDLASALAATLTASETSGGTETPTAKGSTASDAGSAAEAITARSATAADTSSSSDTGSVDSSAQKSSSDTGQGTDAVVSLVVQITAPDIATATDAVSLLARASTATETATATDAVLSVFSGNDVSSSDTGHGTDAATAPTVTDSRTEGGSAAETALVAALVTSAETAHGTDAASLVASVQQGDVVAVAETASLSVLLVASEVVACLDAVAQIVGPPVVRDWQELGATVVISGGREATFKITRLEG